jgi:hypothetical protein
MLVCIRSEAPIRCKRSGVVRESGDKVLEHLKALAIIEWSVLNAACDRSASAMREVARW